MSGATSSARASSAQPGVAPRRVAFALLVAASFAQLPVLYALLAGDAFPPWAVMGMGLLAIGLAWAGGCILSWRRVRASLAVTALGVAEAALAAVPWTAAALGETRWFILASAAAALAALVVARRR